MTITERRFFGGGGGGGGGGGTGIPATDKGTPDGVATLDSGGKLTVAQIPAAVLTSSALGVASGVATLDSGSKVPAAQLPALAIVDYLGGSSGTANQAAMLALVGQPGDWTVRLDTSTVWMVIGSDSTQLASWKELAYPTAPVTSVAGHTGAVALAKTDVGLANVDNTADTAKPVSTAQATAIAAKPGLAGTAPTASAVGDAGAVGTGTAAARGDHTHGRETFGAATAQTAFGAVKADGVGTQPARNDHAHGTPSLSTSTPQALAPGTAAAAGADTKAANAGHIHALPAFGTTAGTFAVGNDTRIAGAVQATSNLSDLTNAGTARTNLGLGNVTNTADADKPVSAAVASALTLKADLVGGVILSSQLPAIAITDVYPVANQTAMLALTAQRGDVAIRADNGRTYILSTDTSSVLGDWKEMPAIGAITSVNGATGVVVLGKSDVGLDAVNNTADADKPVSTAVAAAIALRLLASSNLADLPDKPAALANLGGVATTDTRLADARTPTGHHASHETGGSDPVTVAQSQVTGLAAALAGKPGLSGATPAALTVGAASAVGSATDAPRTDHVHGLPAFGATAGTIAQGNDGRLSDARTPTAHASTHGTAGSDPVTVAQSQVPGLATALAGKPGLLSGTGSPERAVTGNPGDVYSRTDGNAQTSVWVKSTGTGNTGWVAVAGPLWNVLNWGVRGDGAAGYDDTAALNTMFAAAVPGTTILFPEPVSYYKITGPLTPPSGVTVIGSGLACEIRQFTGFKPAFELFNVNNVTIRGFYLNNNAGPCSSTGGSSFRGDNLYAYCAGVWTNGAGHLIENCKMDKFAIGVYLAATAADGSANNDGGTLRYGNRVFDIEVNQANWGVLWLCQSGLRIRGLYCHDFHDSSAGVNPNHAIYGTGNTSLPSHDVNASNCTTVNLPFGCAYQIKYIDGVVFSNLLADACNGLFNGIDITDASFSNMESKADTTSTGTNWSWTFQKVTTQPNRIQMSNIGIQMASDGLPMLLIADQVMMSNIQIVSNHSGTYSGNNFELSIRGSQVVVDGLRINNVGSVKYRAVQVGYSSSYPTGDVTIRNLECTGTYDLVAWDNSITGRNLIDYNPGAQRGIGTSGLYLDDFTAGAAWGMSRREWTNTYTTTGGTAVTPLPALETITRISAGDATDFTINAPTIKPKAGMVHDVIVANGAGGAMGNVTWNSIYALRTTFTSPPSGELARITFMYESASSKWREIYRSDGAGIVAPQVTVTGLTGATSQGRFAGGTTTGAPTTGTFAAGDYVIARDGAIWVCTGAGTPGTWTQVGGTATDVQIFTANGSWTRPAWAASSSTATTTWRCIAGGGSGGAGAVQASGTAAVGGGGGGSGGIAVGEAMTTNLGSPLSLLVGAGGAAVTGRAAASVGVGSNGNAGGQTNFSIYGTATGGAAGVGGGAGAGGTGGAAGAGNFGAAAAGGVALTTGGLGGNGGSATMGAGGGAGGGVTTAGVAANGGAGGKALAVNSGPAAAVGGVVGGASPAAGWSAPTTSPPVALPGNGGGGGAASVTAAVDAQTGAAGGSYGAGSGGGGAALSTAGASGGSPAGAAGIAIIVTRA